MNNKRREDKWAAKEARADGIRNDGFSRTKKEKEHFKAYRAASAATDKVSGGDQIKELGMLQAYKSGQLKPATSKGDRQLHKEAGEAHLAAYNAGKLVHQNSNGMGSHDSPLNGVSKVHAEAHAAAAGSDWDESKHPRDENGKFG